MSESSLQSESLVIGNRAVIEQVISTIAVHNSAVGAVITFIKKYDYLEIYKNNTILSCLFQPNYFFDENGLNIVHSMNFDQNYFFCHYSQVNGSLCSPILNFSDYESFKIAFKNNY